MEYKELVKLYSELDGTTKRLEKTYFISQFLKELDFKDIEMIVLLIQGKIFPVWDETKIGVADRMVLKAISVSSGNTVDEIEQEWKKIGDLGDVAFKLIGKKSQATLFSESLTVKKVFDNLRKLAKVEGSGSVDVKIKLISELLSSATPEEARYIVRSVLEDLRVGVASGTFRDAITWAYLLDPNYDLEKKAINPENREEYNKIVDVVQNAYNLTNDYGKVIIAAQKGITELEKVSLEVGKPLQVMLAQKALTATDAFKKVGKPAALEYKYDGFRMQIHKKGSVVTLFTRRLENVTVQFPDVVSAVLSHVKADECILDSEAVGFDVKTGKYLVFQNISQRIKRKYNIDELASQFPVELNVFDIISLNGNTMINSPYSERYETLKGLIDKEVPQQIVIAKHIETDSEELAQEFFEKAVKEGNEGLMFKNMDGVYKPGSRVGFMVKLKSEMDTLDLVVTGAEWGEGKRSGWFTSFTLSCYSEDGLVTIGKVGTGFKELDGEGVTFKEMTELLKPLVESEKGKEVSVRPKIVLEIKFEEIQKSPSYGSGFALRFPRVVQIRYDRSPDQISTLDEVDEAYLLQK